MLDDHDPEFVARWQRLLDLQAHRLPDPPVEPVTEDPALFDRDYAR